jgi:hypothetical protein
MTSLFDTKAFGATFTWLMALGVSYVANVPGWALLVVPLSVVAAYWLIHWPEAAVRDGRRLQRIAASKVARTKGRGEALTREANLLINLAAFERAKRRALADH